ncbi:MAG: hypothetical protein ACREIA_23425 [Opitutaceae bacterium]
MTSTLVDLPDAVLWTSRTWTDFAKLPARQRASTLIVLPLFGFGDWGLGRPIDLEEQLGVAVLRQAVEKPGKPAPELLVMPPLRFVLGPYVHNLFGIDFETALELLHEIATSVKAAGFRKLVLFTTSPWNEELIEAAGLTMRVRLGIQAYQISLAALGLDLHPLRASDRSAVQLAATACTHRAPNDAAMSVEAIALREFRPGNVEQPGPVKLTLPLEEAIAAGEKLMVTAGRKFSQLCLEIARKAALPNEGRIGTRRAPDASRAAAVLKTARKK